MRQAARSAAVVSAFLLATHVVAQAPARQPSKVFTGTLNRDQQLAHDIYKELIEINSGVTTGNVTTAAVAMAKRFREAGIPESDIFVGGPRPDKHNVVVRIHGKNPGSTATNSSRTTSTRN